MTTDKLPNRTTALVTGRSAPAPAGRGVVARAWRAVLDIVRRVDAGASIAHGREIPADHAARRRRLDHEEVERRLAALYPRA